MDGCGHDAVEYDGWVLWGGDVEGERDGGVPGAVPKCVRTWARVEMPRREARRNASGRLRWSMWRSRFGGVHRHALHCLRHRGPHVVQAAGEDSLQGELLRQSLHRRVLERQAICVQLLRRCKWCQEHNERT